MPTEMSLKDVAEMLRFVASGATLTAADWEQAATLVEAAAREQGAAEVVADELERFGCPLTDGGPNAAKWAVENCGDCDPVKDKPICAECWLAYAAAEAQRREGK